MTEYNNERVVPLVVKKGPQQGTGAQKFRLPFKNLGSLEIEVDFSFAKLSAVICGPHQAATTSRDKSSSGSSSNDSLDNKKGSEQQQVSQSPIEFSVVPPATMKVPANGGSVILNI
jgi:hypothetical protein